MKTQGEYKQRNNHVFYVPQEGFNSKVYGGILGKNINRNYQTRIYQCE